MFTFPFLLVTVLLFVLGAVVGSFVNVVICRTILGESWVGGRSRCDHCHKTIRWFDNVPLASFFLLRGVCRYCKKPISMTNPVVEFLTGTLFVWWYWGGFFFFRLTAHPYHYIQPLFWLLVGILLLLIFFTDLMYSIIPDEAVGTLIGLTLVYRIALTLSGIMQFQDLLKTLLGAVIVCAFFFSLWFFTKGKGMGFGDVKFAIPFALLLGWPNVFVGFFLSFLIGGVVSGLLVLFGRKKMRHTVPFGPFLIIGLGVTLLYGTQLLQWYFSLM